MHRIVITGPAKADIQAAHDWWAKNRSAEQAARWYQHVRRSIDSLRENPDRCGFALEKDLLDQGIRQLLVGTGRRATHRIVFTGGE